MKAGSAGELGKEQGLEQVGFWKKILAHPSYDAFWSDQAVDKVLAQYHEHAQSSDDAGRKPLGPGRHLRSDGRLQGDQAAGSTNDKVFLVIGPWHHGQEIGDGEQLGAIAVQQRHRAFLPAAYSAALSGQVSEGRSRCQRRIRAGLRRSRPERTSGSGWPAWPAGCANGCTVEPTPLYLTAGLGLSFTAPAGPDAEFDDYVSDPAKPVPFRRASDPAHRLRPPTDLAAVAGRRPAGAVGADRRADVHVGRAEIAGADQRAAGRQSGRVDQRHRLRLGGEADRRVSRRSRRPARAGRLSS